MIINISHIYLSSDTYIKERWHGARLAQGRGYEIQHGVYLDSDNRTLSPFLECEIVSVHLSIDFSH